MPEDEDAVDWLSKPLTWREDADLRQKRAKIKASYTDYLQKVQAPAWAVPWQSPAVPVPVMGRSKKKKDKLKADQKPKPVKDNFVDFLMLHHKDKDPWDE